MTSAAAKLQPSRLSDQRELLRDDLDISHLNLGMRGRASLHIAEAITDTLATRTIEGASTIELTVADRDLNLLRSGFLTAEQTVLVQGKHTVSQQSAGLLAGNTDIEIDGLWFRLVGFRKTGRSIKLTFEDREVALLRSYPRPGAPHNGFLARTTTRFAFAKSLVNEVKELDIRFVCPDLKELDAIAAKADKPTVAQKRVARAHGFTVGEAITVKTEQASPTQISNLERVLDVAVSLKASRKAMVITVMVVTQESSALTTATNGVHVGLFQQDPAFWPATRNPEKDAHAFISALQTVLANPAYAGSSYATIGEAVQRSGQGALYGLWRTEAEHTVGAYLGDNSVSATLAQQFQQRQAAGLTAAPFVRGKQATDAFGNKIYTREDNWACLQRLAAEIGYRCFCVSGTIYIVGDERLFRSQVAMTLSEASDGVDSIDGDLISGKKFAELTIAARASRWKAPPGTVIKIEDMGPLNGRWMVSTISRPLTKTATTITVRKPQPSLPEDRSPEFGAGLSSGTEYKPTGSGATQTGDKYNAPGNLVQPVPAGYATDLPADANGDIRPGRIHPTANLPGYPAIDFFAPAGSPVVALEDGKIARFSGHDPVEGPVSGPHGPLGWSIYLQGDSGTKYYLTHLGKRTCVVGQRVTAGFQIATVADYLKYGTPSHTHVGVHGGPVSIDELGRAPLAQKQRIHGSHGGTGG